MNVAVSMILQKYQGTKIESHTRLEIVYDCNSTEEATGTCVAAALRNNPEYTISSVCSLEVHQKKQKTEM